MATILEWDSGTIASAGGSVTGSIDVVADSGFDRAVVYQSASQNFFQWSGLSVSAYTVRMYITMPSAWSSSSVVLLCSQISGGSQNAMMYLAGTGAPGQVRLNSSGGQVAASANGLVSVSTVYRWELQVDTVNQTLRSAIFALSSDTPAWDSGVISTTVAGPATIIKFGKGVNAMSSLPDISISRVKAVNTVGSWIGRHATDVVNDPSDDDSDSAIALWNAVEAQSSALLGIWNGSSVDLIETGSEIWVWRYDWTNNVWTTPPATRPSAEVIRVMASGPAAPSTDDYPSWMGKNSTDWADGKAIVHYLLTDS